MEQWQKDVQEHQERMTSARAALLLERQQARVNKELRRAMDNANSQLAQVHDARWVTLNLVDYIIYNFHYYFVTKLAKIIKMQVQI